MKKYIILMSTIIFACSCSKGSFQYNDEYNYVNDTFTVTIDEAEQELLGFMEEFEPVTKGGNQRIIESRFSKGGRVLTKSGEYEYEPLVHVFNFSDDNGFAIISGDKRVEPVLCLIDSGHLDENAETDNPGFFMVISDIDTYYRIRTGMPIIDENGNYVYSEKSQPTTKSTIVPGATTPDGKPVYYEYHDWTSSSQYGTVLECEWNQGSPFNEYCFTSDGQKALAGCFPIAVAQIMYYWKHSYSYNGTYWDWSKMKNIINYRSQYTYPEAMTLVQRFIAALGDSNNLAADYGTSETSAYVSNIERTFKNFGYTQRGNFQDYDFNTLRSNISSGPALIFGNSFKHITKTKALGIVWKTETTYSGGHLWVADQVVSRDRKVSVFVDDQLDYSFTETQHLVHCNWGWGGTDNGYYLYSKFDASINGGPVTKSKTTETSGIKYYYQYNLRMNCGIRK